jgi:hypothetical protein
MFINVSLGVICVMHGFSPVFFPPVDVAAPVAVKAEENGDVADLINKYGKSTFWGMFAAILVSKEVFIIDAEFMLACEIGAFVLTGYVLTGDTLNKMSEEQDKATVAKFEAANDFMIEMFTQYKMVNSTLQNKPAVMKQYAEEYKSAIEAHAAYQTIKPAHAARASVLAALESIKVKEEHATAMAWQEAVDAATANVTAAFEGDKKLEDEMFTLAVQNLGFSQPDTTEQNDPVKRLFMKEFQEE